MKTILITGASGFIGRSLSLSFLNKGYQVYGIDVFTQGMESLKTHPLFTGVQVSKDNFDALDMQDIKGVDIAYHLGWAGKLGGADLNDYDLQMSNVQMTKSLLDKLIEIGLKKFVFCGSISNYKYMNDVKEQYDQDVNADIYGLAKKFAGELACNRLRYQKIDCNIALLANTFGVGDQSQKAVNTLIRKFFKAEKLTLIDGKTPNDWVYIDDTVNGLIAVGERGLPYKEYYLGHREIHTFQENLEGMKEVLHSDLELPFGTYHDITYADYTKVDLQALYQDTGFACTCDFNESLKKTAHWLKQQDEGEQG